MEKCITRKEEGLLEKIKKNLVGKKETIAVAESVTSGMLQTAFASVTEATTFYQGGLTAYNLGQKYRHLGVEPIHAQSCNCVSGRVAVTMARNVCSLFGSDWGIGITGYAAPSEQSGDQVYAFFAIVYKGEVRVLQQVSPPQADPYQVNCFYCTAVLQDLAGQTAAS
jgi:nicotinamide-nucleotide amidase